MSNVELKPARVFEQFAKINQIPRPSKHEEKMIEYLKTFGKKHGLETKVDETGNVLIKKPATPGYENRKTTILQSHMDMVCDKLVDVDFNFETDPIQTYVDGEWMHAKGTTLGDEETGLTGAFGMKPGFMNGDYLINLDSEDEGEIFISCAGGINTTAIFKYTRESAPENYFFMLASLKGLNGGHSGDDIEKKRANAIKILSRFLYDESQKTDLRLAQWNSGRMHNAIPRDGKIIFAVPFDKKEEVKADWNLFTEAVEDEYHITDTAMVWTLESTDAQTIMPKETSEKLILALQALDNGVFAMCQDEALAWMVETSSNVASVQSSEDKVVIVTSQRSNVMSNLRNMANTIKATFQLAGAEVVQNDGYPAWKMRTDSKLQEITVEAYKKLFGKEPKVLGIHAGLECGLFSEKYPNLDMVSFGPTLRNVHTPDEKLHIPTVQMVWDHLLEILKNIPE